MSRRVVMRECDIGLSYTSDNMRLVCSAASRGRRAGELQALARSPGLGRGPRDAGAGAAQPPGAALRCRPPPASIPPAR
ncbi:unnamed protein product [Leptosia nina]|uniref:Uncharacterized protein n=1 Tax=Leptosia nina TaxID=320188 RepID=A0AAV1IU64_9NEOP